MATLKFCSRDNPENVQAMCADSVTATDFDARFTDMSDIALLIPVDFFTNQDVYQFAISGLQHESVTVDHQNENSPLDKSALKSREKFLDPLGQVCWTVVYAKVSDTHCWGVSLDGNKKKRKQIASLALHFVLNLMGKSKCEHVRGIFHLPASPNYQSPLPAAASTDGWNLEGHYRNHPERSFHYHTASRPGVVDVLIVFFHGYDHNKKNAAPLNSDELTAMSQRFGSGVKVAFLMPLLIQRQDETHGWWLWKKGRDQFHDVHLVGKRDQDYMASVANLIWHLHDKHHRPRLVFAGYSAGGYAAIALANYFGAAWTAQNQLPPVFAVVTAAGYGEGSLENNHADHAQRFRDFVEECKCSYRWVEYVVILHAEQDQLSSFTDMEYFFDRLKRWQRDWQHFFFHTILSEDANRDKRRKKTNHGYFGPCFTLSSKCGGTESFDHLANI